MYKNKLKVGIAASLLVTLFTAVVIRAQPADWAELNGAAQILLQEGKYDRALGAAENALEVALATHGEGHPSVRQSLDLLAKINIAKREYQPAEAFVRRSLQLYEANPEGDASPLLSNLSELARWNENEGRLEQARDLERLKRRLLAGPLATARPPSLPPVNTSGGGTGPGGGQTDAIAGGGSPMLPSGSPPDSQPNLPLLPQTGDPIAEIDRILEGLSSGNIAFNTPEKMNIAESMNIQLLLSLQDDIEVLKGRISAEGNKIGAEIKVSARMEAHLTGNMFDILPEEHQVQAVSSNQDTEWIWEVIPLGAGNHSLHLTLNALLEIDGRETPRKIKSYVRKINVTVTGPQRLTGFFKGNWQWLWAVLLVPVVGWLWRKFRSTS